MDRHIIRGKEKFSSSSLKLFAKIDDGEDDRKTSISKSIS